MGIRCVSGSLGDLLRYIVCTYRVLVFFLGRVYIFRFFVESYDFLRVLGLSKW